MKITDLKCNSLDTPLGIDTERPKLSWKLRLDCEESVAEIVSWQVVVSSSEEKLNDGIYDIWDSDIRQDLYANCICCDGQKLISRKDYYWKVIAKDNLERTHQSQVAQWSMGLLKRADWKAQWIGRHEKAGHNDKKFEREPVFGKAKWIWHEDLDKEEVEFSTTFESKVDLSVTKLWILADDGARVYLNGNYVGLATQATAHGKSFPIPEHLDLRGVRQGKNVLSVSAWRTDPEDKTAGVIARLQLEDKDLITDSSWQVRETHSESYSEPMELCSFGARPWHYVNETEYRNLPARYLRKDFTLEDKPIAQARLYASGLGYAEYYINGQKVSDELRSPALSDYDKTVYYRTYDVLSFINKGVNAIGSILGNGRFNAPRLQVPFRMKDYGTPRMIAQLEVIYIDGTKQTLCTDSSWLCSTDGAIGLNNEFDGEHYDARKSGIDCFRPSYKSADYSEADIMVNPLGALKAQTIDPIRAIRRIEPVEVWETNHGTRIYDFGENIVGFCHVVSDDKTLPEQLLRLHHAEILWDKNDLSMINLRSALCCDHLQTAQGVAIDYTPKFITHGFRYLEITTNADVLPEIKVSAVVVNDDVKESGKFECSNALLNQLLDNIKRGTTGNYQSIPTDCPQRDERMGWLGDRSGGAPGEMFMHDVSRFYSKWLDDIRSAQSPSGSLPDIAPTYWFMHKDNATWPGTYVFVIYWLYRHYADTEVVSRHFSGLCAWLDLMSSYLNDDLLDRDVYGDWCAPPEQPHLIITRDPDRMTDSRLIASSYFYKCLKLGSQLAVAIGENEQSGEWETLAERIKDAINLEFYDSDTGLYGNGSQTSQLLPLAFDIVAPAERAFVFSRLVENLTEFGAPEIRAGLIGMQWLLTTLCRHGRADLAYALATRTDYPSWGYMIEKGATTIWELWNGDTASPLMNSGNHVMLVGDCVRWLYEDIAGIHPLKPGFREIELKPQFNNDLDYVNCSEETIFGTVTSNWKRDHNGCLYWEVEIPIGVIAYACLSDTADINQGISNLPDPENVIDPITGSSLSRYLLPSGKHSFEFKASEPELVSLR